MSIGISAINNIQPARIMKAKDETQTENLTTLKEENTDLLSNPMETVGRSQVNFRAKFSAQDLNTIADKLVQKDINLSKTEMRVCKNALSGVMERFGCKDLKQLREYSCKSLDDGLDVLITFVNKALEIEPNIDLQKVDQFSSVFFI